MSPLASTLDTFFTIMTAGAGAGSNNVYYYIAVDVVAPIAIMLCFIFLVVRFAYNLWQKDLDHARAVVKENWVRFFVLVFICVPLNGATMNLNFIGAWPWFIAKSGIDFGDTVANKIPVYNPDWTTLVDNPDAFVQQLGSGDCSATIPAGATPDQLVGLGTADFSTLFMPNTNGILGVAQNAVMAVDSIKNFYTQFASKYEVCLEKKAPSSMLKKAMDTLGLDAVWKVLTYIKTILKYLPVVIILALLLSLVGATAFLLPFLGALAVGATAPVGVGVVALVGLVLSAVALIVARVLSGSIFVYALTFAFFGVLIQWLAEVCVYAVSFPLSAVNLAFGEGQKNTFIRHFAKGIQLLLVPALASVVFGTALILFGSIMVDQGLLSKMGDVFIGNYSTAYASLSNPVSGVTGGVANIMGLAIRSIIFGLFGPFIVVVPLAKVMFGTFSVAESIVGGSVQLVQSAIGGLGGTR